MVGKVSADDEGRGGEGRGCSTVGAMQAKYQIMSCRLIRCQSAESTISAVQCSAVLVELGCGIAPHLRGVEVSCEHRGESVRSIVYEDVNHRCRQQIC